MNFEQWISEYTFKQWIPDFEESFGRPPIRVEIEKEVIFFINFFKTLEHSLQKELA